MLFLMIALIIMTFLGAFAGLFLKKASSNNFKEMLKNINIYLGASCYLAAAILNIIVLQKLDYSFVLPFTAVTYVWTMVVSFLFLKEKINRKKIFGVIAIVIGAVLIAVG